MALHNNLPVYKASYDLLVHVFEQVRHFNRDYKYTLGERLQNEAVDLITHIYRANGERKKTPYLEKAITNVEVLKLYIRLTRDLKLINIPHFADMSQKLENVSKQLIGWHKSQVKKEL
jgi:hypothetical protein